MTVRQALVHLRDIEADLFLAHAIKQPKEFLYMHPEHVLTTRQWREMESLAKKRRNGMPAAYILGYKDFAGLRFKVSRDVLVPRPETEKLVEMAAAELNAKEAKLRVLDVGTGSGCIIISLAAQSTPKQRRSISFSATDVSRPALSIARRNAKTHKVNIKFSRSDLLSSTKGKFDIITANLPYILPADYQKLIKNLNFEPKSALTDGTKTWKLYERFFRQLPKRLAKDGSAFLEIDPKSKAMLTKWARKYLPEYHITFSKDLRRLVRYAKISK